MEEKKQSIKRIRELKTYLKENTAKYQDAKALAGKHRYIFPNERTAEVQEAFDYVARYEARQADLLNLVMYCPL